MCLARQGAQIVLHYRSSKAEAEQTAAELTQIGKVPLLLQGDVVREQTWLDMRAAVLERFGRLDVLINNAAIFYPTPFLTSTEDDWDRFMNVNLKSVYLGCRIFGEQMVQQGAGKIINIADISAEKVWPGYIPYCVSKAGVIAMTRGLARALAPQVTVNAVAPGAILLPEDFSEAQAKKLRNKIPLKRFGAPEDIAKTIAFLIKDGDYINGMVINVDGGQQLS